MSELLSADRRRAMLRTAMGPAIASALADPATQEIMVNPDGTLKAQAYLVYDMRSTQQQYSFVVQGEGSWRMEGNAITLIVPKVVNQDRSETKHPELVNDKDLVPEDLSDTWTVQAHQGKNMRVIVGSLADEMLCQKE